MTGTNGDTPRGPDGYPKSAMRESWNNVYDLSLGLSNRINQHCRDTGERFDKMILIPRGALYPVNIVSRELGFTAEDIITMGIRSYKPGTTERDDMFEYGQMPSPKEVRGLDLLIVEEVCDTGHTLAHTYDLLELAGVGLVRTGVLHYKPGQSKTGFKPDWWMVETEEWIVYPWEKNEANGRHSLANRNLVPEVSAV